MIEILYNKKKCKFFCVLKSKGVPHVIGNAFPDYKTATVQSN